MESQNEIKQSVRRQFGASAADYAHSAVHVRGPDLDAMLAAAALRGDEDVLDIGCGAGHTALAFATRCGRVEALDLTEPMLVQARRLARERGIENVSFRLGDAEAMPYPNASFDRVTARQCTHHFPDPGRALDEIARVLRTGGVFLLVDSIAPETPILDTFLNTIERLRDPSHVRDHSISQWLSMLEARGLEAIHRETWWLLLDFEDWVQRMRTRKSAVAEIRQLFATAPDPVRAGLRIAPDGSHWSIPAALIEAKAAPI